MQLKVENLPSMALGMRKSVITLQQAKLTTHVRKSMMSNTAAIIPFETKEVKNACLGSIRQHMFSVRIKKELDERMAKNKPDEAVVNTDVEVVSE